MKKQTKRWDKKELNKILALISTADHECEYCCADIFGHFIGMYKKEAESFFKNKFKISLEKFNEEKDKSIRGIKF